MFDPKTYKERRKKLKEILKSGMVYLPGNIDSPMNYPDNTYDFRQDSTFLYYFGLDFQGLAGVIDVDNDKDILFGDDPTIEDIVWMGPQIPLTEKAEKIGAENILPSKELANILKGAQSKGQKIHFLPQYRAENKILMEQLLGIKSYEINNNVSEDCIKAVVAQRSIKSDEEVAEIEKAIEISYDMNVTAMKMAKPGLVEQEIYGVIKGIAQSQGNGLSFPVIFSIHPETLHNHYHGNTMKDGDILVLDSGAESPLHYASDITRTFPVNGKYSDMQKAIYNIVLKANLTATEMMKPGVPNRDCHLTAAKIISEGLKDLGLMKGNIDDAVSAGAHALFMPHGLGHMMGLDVHDMENLGEDYVGYNDEFKRSDQFGLAYLRMGKRLEAGHVMTVEPGCYFIPQLIENWKNENKHADFINYGEVTKLIGIGGFRIEDDILITPGGHRLLGKPIPKTVEEVEAVCNS